MALPPPRPAFARTSSSPSPIRGTRPAIGPPAASRSPPRSPAPSPPPHVSVKRIFLWMLLGAVAVTALIAMVVILMDDGWAVFGKAMATLWNLTLVSIACLYTSRLLARPAWAPVAYGSFAMAVLSITMNFISVWGTGYIEVVGKLGWTANLWILWCIAATFVGRRSSDGGLAATGGVAIGALALFCFLTTLIIWAEMDFDDTLGRFMLVLMVLSVSCGLIMVILRRIKGAKMVA